jgi:hypothetical protein
VLTESSYLTAIYTYCGAAILAALLLAWWLGRRWRNGWTALLVLLASALLLTPAYPQPGAETMAPALIVASFEFLLNGPEAAQHAIKPLAIACGLAVGLALLLRATLLRPRKSAAGVDRKPTEEDSAG